MFRCKLREIYIYSVFLKTYMIQVTVINLLEGLHNIMYTEFFEQ
jgi:hypothetical protein